MKSVTINSDYSVSTNYKNADPLRLSTSAVSHLNDYKIMTNNRVLLIDHNEGIVNEVDSQDSECRVISLDGKKFDRVKDIQQSNLYYYILGTLKNETTPVLLKISLEDDTYTSFFTEGLFDVYMFSVSRQDEICFNALRLEDGKKIIGNIDSDGTISIIENNSDIKTFYLQKLN